jgi:hypothetical protein
MGASAEIPACPEPHAMPRFLKSRPSRIRLIYEVGILAGAVADSLELHGPVEHALPELSGRASVAILLGFACTACMMMRQTGVMLHIRKNAGFPRSPYVIVSVFMWAALGAGSAWVSLLTVTTAVHCEPGHAGWTVCAASYLSPESALSVGICIGVYVAAGVAVTACAYQSEMTLRRAQGHLGASAAGRRAHSRRSPARRIMTIAVLLAGTERAELLEEEWSAHLAGKGDRKDAVGFLVAGVRLRFADACDVAWTPIDAILKSRTLSNLLVFGISAIATVDIGKHAGRLGVIQSAESLIEIGGAVYGLIRVGRWYRDVKPPEPKARRAKNDEPS